MPQNTQNRYSPQTVLVDGGLDFINPKINVAPGSLSGNLNFERTDRVGMSRSKGNEPFDGGASPSLAYTNLAYINFDANMGTTPVRNELFVVHTDGSNGPTMGFIVSTTTTQAVIAVVNFDEWRLVQAAMAASTSIVLNSAFGDEFTVHSIGDFDSTWTAAQANPSLITSKDLVLERNTLFKAMSALVGIPGDPGKPTIGLKGFKDQLYAIKDLQTVYFTNGTTQLFGNDILSPHGSVGTTNDFRVLDVHLISGSYGAGTATGLVLFDKYPYPTNGAYDLKRPSTTTNNVLNIATAPGGTNTTPWFAGMFRSNNYEQAMANSLPGSGWSSVDLGFSLNFEDGLSTGPFRVARRGTFSNFDTDTINTGATGTVGSTSDSTYLSVPVPGDSWTIVGGADVPTVLASDDTTSFVRRTISNADPNSGYVPGNIYISDFPAFSGFASSSSVDVQGIEITVVCRPLVTFEGTQRTFSVAVQPVTGDTTLQVGTNPEQQNLVVDFSTPVQQVQRLTFGSPTDLWGLDAATMKAGMDSGWGFAIQPWVQIVDGIRDGIIDVLYAQVTVYYTATVSQYYFWDGSSDVTADITGFFVTDGDWSTSDAQGNLQVTNIQPVSGADRKYIKPGDQIRTDPGGGGLLIATVTSDLMVWNGLETLAQIEAVDSRYEFIVANFYGDADFEAMYGVSGAGRAFSWDGFYFDHIWTQEDASKDMPRHLFDHQFHLVLGYNSGASLISALGDPTNFDGTLGATEIDTGDPVQNYIRMNGTTLGIFCKNSAWGLVGTSIDNFSLSVLSPYEGTIEYMATDVGKPVYCSYRGMSFFEQTAAYGSYAGSRLSTAVSPWLLPRLQGSISPIGSTATSFGPVCVVPVRTTNQARTYFGDGYRLTMTLVFAPDGSSQPMFTFQADGLYDSDGNFVTYLVPRANESYVDSTGSEHIYLTHYSSAYPPPDNKYYIYEYEKSWTWNGNGIPAYLVLNENFYGSLFDTDNVRKVRVEGLSLGYAPITSRIQTDFATNADANQPERFLVPISLPRDPNAALLTDYTPFTNIANYASRGVSFNYRFMSYDTENTPAGMADPIYADVCPPFVIQALLIQNTENKADV